MRVLIEGVLRAAILSLPPQSPDLVHDLLVPSEDELYYLPNPSSHPLGEKYTCDVLEIR